MIKKYISYVQNNPHGYWFKRKIYGWGWTPVKWQGWLASILYTGIVVLLALRLNEESSTDQILFSFVLPVIVLTITFICIAFKKGESPKWQWGNWEEE